LRDPLAAPGRAIAVGVALEQWLFHTIGEGRGAGGGNGGAGGAGVGWAEGGGVQGKARAVLAALQALACWKVPAIRVSWSGFIPIVCSSGWRKGEQMLVQPTGSMQVVSSVNGVGRYSCIVYAVHTGNSVHSLQPDRQISRDQPAGGAGADPN
jgi:hypothetical protein